MTDTLTPSTTPVPQSPRGGGARIAAIAIAIAGGVLGLATIAQGAVASWPSSPDQQAIVALDAADLAGATALSLDMGGADVTVAFADVDDATLEVDAPDADRWRLELRGTTIEAHDGQGWGPFDWRWGLGWSGRAQTATLVLPASLAGELDGDLDIGSGSIDATGEWRHLAVELASGRADVAGSATSASIDVASGSATVDLVVDGDVALDLASGELLIDLEHTGDLEVDVASGSVEARLLGGPYDVTSDAAVGEAVVDVPQQSGADQAIAIDVATGSVRVSAR